jgi:tRNA pseudouridine55 synthase
VRALARDLGASLGVGGHLVALRRTRVGPFTLEQASDLDALAERGHPITLSLADAVRTALPSRIMSATDVRELGYGRRVPAAGITGVYGAFDAAGEVCALLTEADGQARPVLVFGPLT